MIKLGVLKQAHKIEKYLSGRVASPIKVYECFTTALSGSWPLTHLPPCQKHTTHTQMCAHAHTYMDTHRRRRTCMELSPHSSCWCRIRWAHTACSETRA